MHDFSSFVESLVLTMSTIKILDFVDIAIVAFIFYKIFSFVRDTRAEQLFKGIFLLIVITQISSTFKFYTLHWILVNSLEFGVLAILIIFQSELRTGLERLGRTNFKFGKGQAYKNQQKIYLAINDIVDSAFELSKDKIGALIVIEKETKLTDIIGTGTQVDALISKQLLVNIFTPNTPLHDGAVVVRDFKVTSCGCSLPLTQRKDLSKDLGTRHRAGIGISEISDSITLMVSEETGKVSIAQNGKLSRDLTREETYKILVDEFTTKLEEKSFLRSGFINDRKK